MRIAKQLINKKSALIALPVVAVLITGGIVLAHPESKDVSTNQVRNLSMDKTTPAEQPTAQEVQKQSTPVVEQAVTPQPSTPAPSTPTPTPPTNTAYSADTSNPGYMRVYDKQAVMAQAGIAADDYNYVEVYVARKSGWSFKEDGSHSLCGPVTNEAGASDWRTNPVTQLRVCNEKAKAYGGWALYYKSNR